MSNLNEKIQTKFGIAMSSPDGYYRISSRKEGNNRKLLHRLIFEDFYGSEIPEGYVVHHKDENKQNNCILNLQLMKRAEHMSIHSKGENHHYYGISRSDELKKKLSKRIGIERNTSGYFRVCKKYSPKYSQGFTWVYNFHDENGKRVMLSSVDLDKLKERVLAKGLEWFEVN